MKGYSESLVLLFLVVAFAVLAVFLLPGFSVSAGFAIGNSPLCVQGSFVSDSAGGLCSLREYDSGSSVDFNCSNGCVQGACLSSSSVNVRLAQYCVDHGYGGQC